MTNERGRHLPHLLPHRVLCVSDVVRDGSGGDAPMNVRSRCPVCWRKVAPTTGSRIGAHWDNVGALCPGGGEPYSITITLDRRALRKEAA